MKIRQNTRKWLRQNFQNRQRMLKCIYTIPGDTEQWRESGDAEEKQDCKYMFLWAPNTTGVQDSFTSDKKHQLQDFELPSLAVCQWNMGVDQKRRELVSRFWEASAPNNIWHWNRKQTGRDPIWSSRGSWRWPTVKICVFGKTSRNKAEKKTKIQVGGWVEQQ
jgi:hypothetical protein